MTVGDRCWLLHICHSGCRFKEREKYKHSYPKHDGEIERWGQTLGKTEKSFVLFPAEAGQQLLIVWRFQRKKGWNTPGCVQFILKKKNSTSSLGVSDLRAAVFLSPSIRAAATMPCLSIRTQTCTALIRHTFGSCAVLVCFIGRLATARTQRGAAKKHILCIHWGGACLFFFFWSRPRPMCLSPLVRHLVWFCLVCV